MRRIKVPKVSPAMVVACMALFMALGGLGYAAVVLPKNSVGTTQLKAGAVRSPDIYGNAVNSSKIAPNSVSGLDVNEGSLAQVPLAANADNATQLDGIDSASVGTQKWAVMNADGTLARGRGVSLAGRDTGPGGGGPGGVYRITFDEDIYTCAWSVAVSATGIFDPGGGEASAAVYHGGPIVGALSNTLRVWTRDSAGTLADRPFHVAVFC